MTPEERAKLEGERAELSRDIIDLDHAIKRTGAVLSPVWIAEQNLKDLIVQTHGRAANGALVFKLSGSVERVPLWDRLLKIAIDHGKTKQARAEMKRQRNAFARRVESIDNMIRKGMK
jgi:hypothetical protein